MEQNDTQAIMQSISDARAETLQAIGALHSEFAEFKGAVGVRVEAVEKEQEKTEKRQWVHSIVVAAGTMVHHDIGQWLHWKF